MTTATMTRQRTPEMERIHWLALEEVDYAERLRRKPLSPDALGNENYESMRFAAMQIEVLIDAVEVAMSRKKA